MQQENINFKNIDFKTQSLLKNVQIHQQRQHITPGFAFAVIAILLTTVTFFGSINVYQQQQQRLALDQLEQERDDVFTTDYIYTTLIDNYQ